MKCPMCKTILKKNKRFGNLYCPKCSEKENQGITSLYSLKV